MVDLREILAVVDAFQDVEVGLGDIDDFFRSEDAVLQQHFATGRVFVTGKGVTLWQIQFEVEVR